MWQAAQSMVRDALDAFVHADAERAKDVTERDRVVDAYYAQIFRGLLECMMRDPRSVFGATRVQSVAKYLERIADHATNLAEMVIFMVMRQDVRHQGKLGEPEAPHAPRGVLFLCVANSARSQIAEGWARKLLGPGPRIYSAGSAPAPAVHPYAVEVMREAGVDIGSAKPKAIADIPLRLLSSGRLAASGLHERDDPETYPRERPDVERNAAHEYVPPCVVAQQHVWFPLSWATVSLRLCPSSVTNSWRGGHVCATACLGRVPFGARTPV